MPCDADAAMTRASVTRRIPCQRRLFDIADDVAYFNCAYISPLLRSVVAAAHAGLEREAHPWQVQAADFFAPPDQARALFAGLIHSSPDDIAIVPSASYGIATAAANLPAAAGQTIVVLEGQYPSNVYAWRRLAGHSGARLETVTRPADGDWTRAVLDAIDARTAIVAMPHCHWMDGRLLDLGRVGEAARAVRAALVVDASQSLGALPLDVRQVQPDFLVCCGYKWLLCPYAISFLYVAPAHQSGAPLEENPLNRERAEDFARLAEYRDGYLPGARRFDMGERAHFTHMPAAIAALGQLAAWGVADIEATLRSATQHIALQAAALGLESPPPSQRAGHFLGLRFPGGVPSDLPARLASEKVFVSIRGDAVRVTPHLYVSDTDVDRLLGVLRKAL